MAPTLRKAVPRILREHRRDVVKSMAAALDDGRDEKLHAARVAIKRLRYNLEFFRSLLAGEAAGALDLLALAQEYLGTISDSDAFERTYLDLLAGIESADPRRTGIEACRLAAHAERRRALESLHALWSRDGAPPYTERLAASISAALASPSLNEEA